MRWGRESDEHLCQVLGPRGSSPTIRETVERAVGLGGWDASGSTKEGEIDPARALGSSWRGTGVELAGQNLGRQVGEGASGRADSVGRT